MNTLTKPLTNNDVMLQTCGIRELSGRPDGSALRWYVVEADTRKHNSAVSDLVSKGYDVFFPRELVRIRPRTAAGRSGAFEWVPRPALFGFMFVKFDADRDAWPRRDSRTGVLRILLGAGGKPSGVNDSWVESMIGKESAALIPPNRGLPPLSVGTIALVMRGSFEGRSGVVVECDRHNAVVEIQAFGGTVPVRVKRMDISGE